ncbi:hypothetical protein BJ508DRAFT_304640 [Ascobolus immersus RN42]|uniref:Uncharacterized protein n=1 Tax=Ascobolus immersus RN42 TaxID=1160509 RepID=A0A3N4IBJ2_ASCIM|nr:hypothetical protein BJ508DRAFT_304640 [Ascobolus immersus RN42]
MQRNFSHKLALNSLSPPAWQGLGYQGNQHVPSSFNTPGAESFSTTTDSQQSGGLLPSPFSFDSDTTGTSFNEEYGFMQKMDVDEQLESFGDFHGESAFVPTTDYFSDSHGSSGFVNDPSTSYGNRWSAFGGMVDIPDAPLDISLSNSTMPQEVQPIDYNAYTQPQFEASGTATRHLENAGMGEQGYVHSVYTNRTVVRSTSETRNVNKPAFQKDRGGLNKRGSRSRGSQQGRRHYCTEPGCKLNPAGFTRKKDMHRHVMEKHREERRFFCTSENFKDGLFCKNLPETGCGGKFKRESHLTAHWKKKKMDKKFLAKGLGIMGLNKTLRQKKEKKKEEALERKESFGLLRKLTGLSMGRTD